MCFWLKKCWYRTYQKVLKVAMCFMNWKEPELLQGDGQARAESGSEPGSRCVVPDAPVNEKSRQPVKRDGKNIVVEFACRVREKGDQQRGRPGGEGGEAVAGHVERQEVQRGEAPEHRELAQQVEDRFGRA